MPKRKRVQEIKRRMRKAVAEVEAEDMRSFVSALAEADPLGDLYWRERERDVHDPDDDCYFYCPHDPGAWREEYDTYLKAQGGST